MEKRNTLKQEYYKLDLGWWKDKEGKPTIEYVNWLEDKLVKNLTIPDVSHRYDEGDLRHVFECFDSGDSFDKQLKEYNSPI